MSTFQVKLTNQFGGPIIEPQLGQIYARLTGQGNLDEVAQKTGTSVQRQMYAMGPNKTNRKLHDGDVFEDCNFWLRYAPVSEGGSVTDINNAFIHVVSNDGSPYIDGQVSTFPRIYAVTVGAGSVFANNTLDILGDNGGPAVFTLIENTGAHPVTVRINGLVTAVRNIASGASLTFQVGDIEVTKLEFEDAGSGATTVVVTLGIESACHS